MGLMDTTKGEMVMPVYKSKAETKDGKSCFFKTQYTISGSDEPQIMISKKFASKSEALKAEHDFLLTAYENKAVDKNMTFQQLFDKFMEYKKDKIKYSTYRGYQYNYPHIKCFMKAKCVNYNLSMYEAWKKKLLLIKSYRHELRMTFLNSGSAF